MCVFFGLADGYCDAFDLTAHIPDSVVAAAHSSKLLSTLSIADSSTGVFDSYLNRIKEYLSVTKANSTSQRQAIRLSIPDFGDANWGDPSPTVS